MICGDGHVGWWEIVIWWGEIVILWGDGMVYIWDWRLGGEGTCVSMIGGVWLWVRRCGDCGVWER